MSPRVPGLLLAALLTVAACATASGGDSTTEAAINARAAAWMEAFNRGDGTAVAAVYAPDGMVLPPNVEPITGREGIARFISTELTGPARVTIVTRGDEVEIHGDTAHRVGNFEVKIADGTVVDRGRFIEIWKRDGGEWYITRDIWNSSLPRP
jgi:uncharacterized protein (TIGR02246 family)